MVDALVIFLIPNKTWSGLGPVNCAALQGKVNIARSHKDRSAPQLLDNFREHLSVHPDPFPLEILEGVQLLLGGKAEGVSPALTEQQPNSLAGHFPIQD